MIQLRGRQPMVSVPDTGRDGRIHLAMEGICARLSLGHTFHFGVTQPTFRVAQCLHALCLCYHGSLQSSRISRAAVGHARLQNFEAVPHQGNQVRLVRAGGHLFWRLPTLTCSTD
jgi:hypothetical protein